MLDGLLGSQHSDIFYLLGVTMRQAVLVMAFEISVIRRVVKLRCTSHVVLLLTGITLRIRLAMLSERIATLRQQSRAAMP